MLKSRIRTAALALGVAAAIAILPAMPASAATSYTPLVASDATSGQRLGFSVAQSSDGQTTVVGSIYRTEGSTTVPSVAYVYIGVSGSDLLRRSEDAQLIRSETFGTSASDSFGSSVDVSSNGDTIVVGADNYSSGVGAVYVFQRTGAASWEQAARLSAPVGASSGGFGTSVAISDDGTKLVAGAPALATASQGGAAYYALENGSWVLKTVVAGGSASALGGQSVAISADGTRAAVGAPQFKASGATSRTGRVYTYSVTSSGLTPLATIVDPSTASTVSTGADFGGGALSFTADNNGLLVAAPFATTVAGSSVGGIAHYYRYGAAWTRSASFSLTGTTNARLGYAGAISPDGNRIVLGAPYYAGTPGGQVFISQKVGTAWGALSPVGPTGNNSSARVGISVAVGTNSRFVIGAILQNDLAGVQSGQAYVVDVS